MVTDELVARVNKQLGENKATFLNVNLFVEEGSDGSVYLKVAPEAQGWQWVDCFGSFDGPHSPCKPGWLRSPGTKCELFIAAPAVYRPAPKHCSTCKCGEN
jgi:hypothetical protein